MGSNDCDRQLLARFDRASRQQTLAEMQESPMEVNVNPNGSQRKKSLSQVILENFCWSIHKEMLAKCKRQFVG